MRTDKPYLMVVKLQEYCLCHDETRSMHRSVMRVQILWNMERHGGRSWTLEFPSKSPWLVFLGGGDAVEAFDVQSSRACRRGRHGRLQRWIDEAWRTRQCAHHSWGRGAAGAFGLGQQGSNTRTHVIMHRHTPPPDSSSRVVVLSQPRPCFVWVGMPEVHGFQHATCFLNQQLAKYVF